MVPTSNHPFQERPLSFFQRGVVCPSSLRTTARYHTANYCIIGTARVLTFVDCFLERHVSRWGFRSNAAHGLLLLSLPSGPNAMTRQLHTQPQRSTIAEHGTRNQASPTGSRLSKHCMWVLVEEVHTFVERIFDLPISELSLVRVKGWSEAGSAILDRDWRLQIKDRWE